jgi:hypothetical protein
MPAKVTLANKSTKNQELMNVQKPPTFIEQPASTAQIAIFAPHIPRPTTDIL